VDTRRSKMKRIIYSLAVLCSFLSSTSNAQNPINIECKNKDFSVAMKIKNSVVTYVKVSGFAEYESVYPQSVETTSEGASHYSFLVNDSDDTNFWFDLYIKNDRIVKRELYRSGNDSDNYYGHKVADGDNAFICIKQQLN